MNRQDTASWMAFAHARGMTNRRKMQFLIDVLHKEKLSMEDAFRKLKDGETLGLEFSEKEWNGLSDANEQVPSYAFLAEKIMGQGIKIVPVMEKHTYPELLKKNLTREAPILLYLKGNSDLLKKNSIAIVGSRNCSPISLNFTDTIAKKAVINHSVVVSGFAKGIDRKALDSALEHGGQSIIVLPQGIGTFTTRSYDKNIANGDVLVASSYHPNAPWSVGRAMDRNKIIHGLAREIYVAESGHTGGTWEGALNGINRGRMIYVRQASDLENNANNLLIEKGALPLN